MFQRLGGEFGLRLWVVVLSLGIGLMARPVVAQTRISATARATVTVEDSAKRQRPNVVVIYSDDQGTLDLNCYGAKDLETPHLDGLAGRGIRFTNMYAPSAICSASRAGLMTGRLPPRAGVPGNVSSQEGVPGMPTEEVTMAEMFRAGGYATGHIGKWHLGYTPETMPNGQGFESSFGHMGGCIDNYSHFFYWNGPNRHDLWRDGEPLWLPGRYFGDLMLEETRQFLSDHKEEPFFLYWAINWPHYPMQGTAKWREHYADLPSPRNHYAAFVSTLDEYIGEFLQELDKQGLTENTIIVFQSDHGHSVEERAFFGGGFAGPYRGAKGCLFEGGLRVPSIVSWPAGLAKGEVRDAFAVGCDWLPTLAELTDTPLPERHLDGLSLREVLLDSSTATPHANWYWQLGGGDNAQWAVRQGDWKLLGNPRDPTLAPGSGVLGTSFLADLKRDPGESRDVSAGHPGVVAELQELAETWRESLEQRP